MQKIRLFLASLFIESFPFSPRKSPFFYGWVIVITGSLGITFSIPGQTMGVSAFTETLIHELNVPRFDLSFAYLIGTTTSACILPFAGTLLDKLGIRIFATIISIAFGLILVLHSYLKQIVHAMERLFAPIELISASSGFITITLGFLLIRFLGQGCLTMASRAMIGKWWHRKRGLIFAVSGTVTSITFALGPSIINHLIETFDWKQAYQILGTFILIAMTLIAWLFFRETPEDSGLSMDGEAPSSDKPEKNQDLVIHKEMTRKQALRTLPFWSFNIALAWFALLSTAYTFHVVDIGVEFGIEKETMFKVFLPIAILSGISTLIIGWVCDHTRLKYILMLFIVAMIIASSGLTIGLSSSGMLLLILGIGISQGAFIVLSGVVWPRYFGRKHLGAISGIHMSSMVIGSALGPVFFSSVKDITGNYHLAYTLSTVIAFLILVTALKADNPQHKLAPSLQKK